LFYISTTRRVLLLDIIDNY